MLTFRKYACFLAVFCFVLAPVRVEAEKGDHYQASYLQRFVDAVNVHATNRGELQTAILEKNWIKALELLKQDILKIDSKLAPKEVEQIIFELIGFTNIQPRALKGLSFGIVS